MLTRPSYPAITARQFLEFSFSDIASERIRIVQRTGPDDWNERGFDEPADVALPSLEIVIPHAEIFARD